jgi:PAS domain S-box-containing protein
MEKVFSNRSIFLLFGILVISGLIIAGFSIFSDYIKTIKILKINLTEIVERQISMITVLKEQGKSDDEIIAFTKKLREKYYNIGKYGEFAIAKKTGDSIEYLISSKREKSFKIWAKGILGRPMSLALMGQSGFIKAKDYEGNDVYAAYHYIPQTSMGIVAKIPVKEIISPYIKAVIYNSVIVVIIMIICVFLFFRITKPLIIENNESQELYRSLFNNNHVVMLLVDPVGLKVVDANPAACEYYGYSKKEISVMDVTSLNTLSLEEMRKVMQMITSGQTKYFNFKHKLSDGKVRDVEVYSGTIKLKRKIYIYSLVYDITDRKLAEEILRENEEKLRIAFYNAPMGMSIIQPDGQYLAVNPALCQMFGYSQEDLLTGTLNRITHPDDVEPGNLWIKKMISGDLSEPEFAKRYIHKDGHLVWGVVRARWIKNADGTARMAVAHIQDVTQQKKTEEELRKYREHLEELVENRTQEIEALNEELIQSNEELQVINQALAQQKEDISDAMEKLKDTQEKLVESEKMASIGILTAGVAHEINNPLNFIQTGIYSIENLLQNNGDEIKPGKNREVFNEILNNINIGIKRASDIVTSLNHFSRSSSNADQNCNLHVIIDNCLLILEHQIKSTCEIVKNYVDKELTILGNEGKLHQAFINILKNAVQAISDNGKITIETSLNKSEDTIQIIISDTGIGIKSEHLSKIYDPFFTTKEPGEGTGLGLSIVYSIIKEHNGTIVYKSVEDKGTEAIVTFPKS